VTTEVVRSIERGRYEIRVDGEVAGFADYHEEGDTVVLPHTVVDPARRGLGLAAVLIRFALDDIAHSGRQVVPSCWYVASFIDRHQEYRSMVGDAAPAAPQD
jgi:predicted GNAT family acetyltransferase